MEFRISSARSSEDEEREGDEGKRRLERERERGREREGKERSGDKEQEKVGRSRSRQWLATSTNILFNFFFFSKIIFKVILGSEIKTEIGRESEEKSCRVGPEKQHLIIFIAF